jgi:putative oxygen-independent coproporphyrinogen III oxidase
VHVPFCSARCDYCAFATWTDRDHLMDAYERACIAEARAAIANQDLPSATSVFFGGGTPSRLPPESLCRILDELPRTSAAEVTVECNPEDASARRFRIWRDGGVNRVSFGAQSMVPAVLRGLGRRHLPGSVELAVQLARDAGFDSLNLDLIFGGAGESDSDWEMTLETVLGIEGRPEHLSCYALTVEPGTPLATDPSRHPDDDTQAERYETTERILASAGFSWYEVSNWAIPGHECRHNILYWRQGDYRGIGCAAHSHLDGSRFWNIRTPERYIAAVGSGASAVAGSEVLEPDEREFEAAALAVRTREGVPAVWVPLELWNEGLFDRLGDRAILTVRGRLLANEVAIRLNPNGENGPKATGVEVAAGILRR